MVFNDIERLAKLFAYIMCFLSTISIGCLVIKNRKDPEKRTKAIKGLFYLFIAAFIITSAFFIANNLNNLVGKLSRGIEHNPGGITGSINSPTQDIHIGFVEGILIGALEFIVNSFKVMREWILGVDISLQNILFNIEENPIVNLVVPLKNGGSINLFNLMLMSVGVFIYIMVVRTGHSIIRFSTDERRGEEVREYLYSWGLIVIYIATAPALIYVIISLSNYMLGLLNKIDFSNSYADVFEMDARKYGIGISIAKIYVIYIEFKIWTIMIFRKAILNGFYVLAPVALAVGQLQEFNSSNAWLGTVIKFAFYPFYYGFSFVIATVVLNGMSNGNNAIVIIIMYGIIFKLADTIIAVFQVVKGSGGRPPKTGVDSMMGMVAYTVTNLVRMNSTKGGNTYNGSSKNTSKTSNNTTGAKVMSTVSNFATNQVRNAVDKIGVSKGFVDSVKKGVTTGAKYGGTVGGVVGKALNSNITKTALSVGVGMAAASIGESPMAGIPAFQASKIMLNKMPIDKIGKGLGKVSGVAAGSVASSANKLRKDVVKDMGKDMGQGVKNYFASADIKSHNRR